MTFKITMKTGERRWVPLLEKIALCSSDLFAVHRDEDGKWKISHVASGCLVASGETPSECHFLAVQRVREQEAKYGFEQWILLTMKRAATLIGEFSAAEERRGVQQKRGHSVPGPVRGLPTGDSKTVQNNAKPSG